jgi:cyclopropane fatty-acyl-phospholipid synthase-like methyltransferase
MSLEFFDQSSRSNAERRRIVKERDLTTLMSPDYHRYGRDYFDDPDSGVGYGRYEYDGRYAGAAKKMCDHYGLNPGDRILEIGCAKGFLLVEFHKLGMDVYGLDASEYAVSQSHPDVQSKIQVGDAADMPFADDEMKLIVGKEFLPHVPEDRIDAAITELDYLRQWDGTHRTMRPPSWWGEMFERLGFQGDVHYKILISESDSPQEK